MFDLPTALAFLIVAVSSGFVESCDFKDKPCAITFTKEQQDEIVDYHNELRRQASPSATNMEKMYWDETLAKMALENAVQCNFQHTPNSELRFSGHLIVGQNLFASSGKPSIKSPVTGWYNEKDYYTYGEATTNTVGHYTQVMRGPAARVGCAEAYCPDRATKYIITCNYLKGQFDLKKPYVNGTTCGECPKTCKDKLCDCGGKVCQHAGTLDINTCKCKCRVNTGGENCEKFTCDRPENKHFCTKNKKFCNLDNGFANFRNMCAFTCGICK